MANQDLHALMQMALDPSSTSRNALAKSVVDLCLEDGVTLSPREFALTFEILHKLLQSVEMGVRRDLAQRLAPRADVPRDLIATLANDQINVAYPILVESLVLEDADLIAIARAHPASHQIAITLREQVSVEVSDVLIDTENVDVIDSLLRNPAARIAPVAMERLVDMSQSQSPLLQREDLQPDLAHRMSAWVGDALKKYIAETYPEASEAVAVDINAAVRSASGGQDGAAASDLSERVSAIEAGAGITAETLIDALRIEDVELFEALFARRTGIDMAAMPALVYDPGGEPFAVACKACGFSLEEFETLYGQLTKSLAGPPDTGGDDLERIRGFYRKLDDGAVRSLVEEWVRSPAKAWDTA